MRAALFCSPQVKQKMVAQARLLGDGSSSSSLPSSTEPSDRARLSLPAAGADKGELGPSTGDGVSSTRVAVTDGTKEPINPETKAVAWLPEAGVEDELELLGLGGNTGGGSVGVGKAAREDEGVMADMVRGQATSDAGERGGVRADVGWVGETGKRASELLGRPSKQRVREQQRVLVSDSRDARTFAQRPAELRCGAAASECASTHDRRRTDTRDGESGRERRRA